MEMNEPAPPNALDENRQGLIGRPLDRVDGPWKVMGKAPYAFEVRETAKPAYGCIVEATIAKGSIVAIDTREAERSGGVLLVLTHRNAPRQGSYNLEDKDDRFARARPQLADATVRHYGQPVAFVVAETFEQARLAAQRIRVRYAPKGGDFDLEASLEKAAKPRSDDPRRQPDTRVGNFEQAFARAEVRIDQRYTTPFHAHAQMEPHAALAQWEGDRVTVHCSSQLLESAQKCLAKTLRIPVEKVRIVSRFIGGGFGGKLPLYGDAILSAIAARMLKRPVKTALTRQQMFHVTTHRSSTIQRVRLGAGADGRLTAIAHEAWSHSARFDDFFETAAAQTRSLYAGAHRMTRQRRVPLDLPVSDSTRAPGEAVGLLALEVAMDELAERLALDPVELRIRNEPEQDPELHIPYSTRQLVRCLREGAERFGWAGRSAAPRARTEGRQWIGLGMAAATRGNFLRPSKCQVRLEADGTLTARMSMTDIGTGSYTIFTQIAAEMLGLPPERVRMELGDSDLPETAGSGGSFGAASAGSALFDACQRLRGRIAERAGIAADAAVFADGAVRGDGRSLSLKELAAANVLSADGEIKPGRLLKDYSQQAYGAQFAEVSVDMDTGEIRL
ncbi:MAG: xanthine dehydrogenase family protein molybdopterin-binding subunit, partial [Betaproteobacteria bacterium]|nr:xanthine dehydrogenase family protein molybdopterin-binding subunit [Betaproteobacteria bacterium]